MAPEWVVVVAVGATVLTPLVLWYVLASARRRRAAQAWSAVVEVTDDAGYPTFVADYSGVRLEGRLAELWFADWRAPTFGLVIRAKVPGKSNALAERVVAELADLATPVALPPLVAQGKLQLCLMSPHDGAGELQVLLRRVADVIKGQ